MPIAAPIAARIRAISIRAVTPSGGAAAGTIRSIRLLRTSDSSSEGRTARLPSPNSAPNHSATTAGNSWCSVIGLAGACLRFCLATLG